MGAKYNIQIGMSGIKNAVAGINEIRTAEGRQRQILKDIAATRSKIARLEKSGADSSLARRKLSFLKAETRELDKQLGKLRRRDKLRRFIGRGVAGFAAGFGLHALGSRGFNALGDAGKLDKQAGTMGVSAEFLQEFQFAAGQFSIASDQSAMGLQRFTRRLAEAQSGKGELLPTLEKLGISLTDTDGKARGTTAVMNDFADALAKMNGKDRLAAGFKAFDSEGAALVNVLKNGAEGFNKLRQQARAADAVIENDVIAQLAAADASLESFGRRVKVFTANLVAPLVGFFSAAKTGIADMWAAWKIQMAAVWQFVSQAPTLGPEAFGQAAAVMNKRLELLARQIAKRNEREAAEAKAFAQPGGAAAQNAAAGGRTSRPTADQLAQIGGFRGANTEFRQQVRYLNSIDRYVQNMERRLQRIEKNTDHLN